MAENRYELNKNLAQMLKGGVIMDVTTPEQARIAESAGAWRRHGAWKKSLPTYARPAAFHA